MVIELVALAGDAAVVRLFHAGLAAAVDALSVPLPTAPSAGALDKSYFDRVFDELEELSEEYDFVLGGNIRIYTYLDAGLQNYLESLSSASETDKIYTVLDNKTHGFKAYYSTVGEIKRLPGSLIKPLLVYAPALEEDMILFETGTFTTFASEPVFEISLVRQFSNDDEFFQLHVDILYKPTSENKIFSEATWNEDLSENIFDYIRKSEVFAYAKNKEYIKVEIYLDET